jgi:hypothetical protein
MELHGPGDWCDPRIPRVLDLVAVAIEASPHRQLSGARRVPGGLSTPTMSRRRHTVRSWRVTQIDQAGDGLTIRVTETGSGTAASTTPAHRARRTRWPHRSLESPDPHPTFLSPSRPLPDRRLPSIPKGPPDMAHNPTIRSNRAPTTGPVPNTSTGPPRSTPSRPA